MENNNFSSGKILRVNLTARKISHESIKKYTNKFLGGRGINQWILYNETAPWVHPFEPANRLIFGTGPLVGTLVPAANRFNVDAKNPYTGGVGSGNAGGYFGPELRFAGWDNIVFQGRASKPVYLWINDNHVEIRDASFIWGSTTWQTDDLIKEDRDDKDIQIACIGPAGENLVRPACIITNKARAVGRCGLGAVMGSKNLKAVAVRGTGSISVENTERFMEAVDEALEKINLSPYAKALGKYGTAYVMPNDFSLMPMRNFQDGYMDPAKLEKLSMTEYMEGSLGGFNCPIHCSHFLRITEGQYAGEACEGIEGNAIWDFGCKLGIEYGPAIIKAHSLCNQYGLDQDNTSGALAWAFECYQRGLLTEQDTDEYQLKWGDHEVVLEFLKKMAYRQGFGDVLAEGSKRASEIIGRGSEKYAMHVKGQDLAEPIRTCKGWALGVVVSTRGGGHCSGAPSTEFMNVSPEVSKKIWDVETAGQPTSYEGKAKMVVYYERFHELLNCLGVCFYTSNWETTDLLWPKDYAKFLSAVTGRKITGKELMLIGERIHNIEKAFNMLHASFSRKDDYPPERLVKEPVRSGPLRGERLDRNSWDKMLDEYYLLHNWDKKTGWPTRKCLTALGLTGIANDLQRAGKLSVL